MAEIVVLGNMTNCQIVTLGISRISQNRLFHNAKLAKLESKSSKATATKVIDASDLVDELPLPDSGWSSGCHCTDPSTDKTRDYRDPT